MHVPAFLIKLLPLLKGHNQVSLEPSLFQAEQLQLSQPFLKGMPKVFIIKVVFSEVNAWKQASNKIQPKIYENLLKVKGAVPIIPLKLCASKCKVILNRLSTHLGRILKGFLPLLYPSS